MAKKPMWVCPDCGRQFPNRNQWHSCGSFSVEQHLDGKSERIIELYEAFVALVERVGPARVSPVKTGVLFKVRKTFAEVNVRREWLVAHVMLPRRVQHPRFTKIGSVSPLNHVHTFKIESLDDIDGQVEEWLREAYWVGEQKHLPS